MHWSYVVWPFLGFIGIMTGTFEWCRNSCGVRTFAVEPKPEAQSKP